MGYIQKQTNVLVILCIVFRTDLEWNYADTGQCYFSLSQNEKIGFNCGLILLKRAAKVK